MMKHKLLLLLLVLLGFLRIHAQNDNPYAIFGHEGKTLKTPQERQRVMLMIENPDTASAIKQLGIDPHSGSYYTFDANNKVIESGILPPSAFARFLSVDPLSSSFAWNSPYCFAENDVIRNIDLDGAEKYNYKLAFDQNNKVNGLVFEKEIKDFFDFLNGQKHRIINPTDNTLFEFEFSSGQELDNFVKGKSLDELIKLNNYELEKLGVELAVLQTTVVLWNLEGQLETLTYSNGGGNSATVTPKNSKLENLKKGNNKRGLEVVSKSTLKNTKGKGPIVYENPGHHDPSSPNFNKKKSVLPENHESLFNQSQLANDGNRWTKVGTGKKAVYHRFQDDGNGNWHWNGSTNATKQNGTSNPISPNNVPKEFKRLNE